MVRPAPQAHEVSEEGHQEACYQQCLLTLKETLTQAGETLTQAGILPDNVYFQHPEDPAKDIGLTSPYKRGRQMGQSTGLQSAPNYEHLLRGYQERLRNPPKKKSKDQPCYRIGHFPKRYALKESTYKVRDQAWPWMAPP